MGGRCPGKCVVATAFKCINTSNFLISYSRHDDTDDSDTSTKAGVEPGAVAAIDSDAA